MNLSIALVTTEDGDTFIAFRSSAKDIQKETWAEKEVSSRDNQKVGTVVRDQQLYLRTAITAIHFRADRYTGAMQ